MNRTVCRTGLRPRTIHPGRNMAGGVATPRPPGPSVTKRRSVVSSPYTISQWRQLHHDTERDSAIAEERQFVSDNTTVVSRNTNIQNGRSMGGGSVMITRDSDDPPAWSHQLPNHNGGPLSQARIISIETQREQFNRKVDTDTVSRRKRTASQMLAPDRPTEYFQPNEGTRTMQLDHLTKPAVRTQPGIPPQSTIAQTAMGEVAPLRVCQPNPTKMALYPDGGAAALAMPTTADGTRTSSEGVSRVHPLLLLDVGAVAVETATPQAAAATSRWSVRPPPHQQQQRTCDIAIQSDGGRTREWAAVRQQQQQLQLCTSDVADYDDGGRTPMRVRSQQKQQQPPQWASDVATERPLDGGRWTRMDAVQYQRQQQHTSDIATDHPRIASTHQQHHHQWPQPQQHTSDIAIDHTSTTRIASTHPHQWPQPQQQQHTSDIATDPSFSLTRIASVVRSLSQQQPTCAPPLCDHTTPTTTRIASVVRSLPQQQPTSAYCAPPTTTTTRQMKGFQTQQQQQQYVADTSDQHGGGWCTSRFASATRTQQPQHTLSDVAAEHAAAASTTTTGHVTPLGWHVHLPAQSTQENHNGGQHSTTAPPGRSTVRVVGPPEMMPHPITSSRQMGERIPQWDHRPWDQVAAHSLHPPPPPPTAGPLHVGFPMRTESHSIPMDAQPAHAIEPTTRGAQVFQTHQTFPIPGTTIMGDVTGDSHFASETLRGRRPSSFHYSAESDVTTNQPTTTTTTPPPPQNWKQGTQSQDAAAIIVHHPDQRTNTVPFQGSHQRGAAGTTEDSSIADAMYRGTTFNPLRMTHTTNTAHAEYTTPHHHHHSTTDATHINHQPSSSISLLDPGSPPGLLSHHVGGHMMDVPTTVTRIAADVTQNRALTAMTPVPPTSTRRTTTTIMQSNHPTSNATNAPAVAHHHTHHNTPLGTQPVLSTTTTTNTPARSGGEPPPHHTSSVHRSSVVIGGDAGNHQPHHHHHHPGLVFDVQRALGVAAIDTNNHAMAGMRHHGMIQHHETQWPTMPATAAAHLAQPAAAATWQQQQQHRVDRNTLSLTADPNDEWGTTRTLPVGDHHHHHRPRVAGTNTQTPIHQNEHEHYYAPNIIHSQPTAAWSTNIINQGPRTVDNGTPSTSWSVAPPSSAVAVSVDGPVLQQRHTHTTSNNNFDNTSAPANTNLPYLHTRNDPNNGPVHAHGGGSSAATDNTNEYHHHERTQPPNNTSCLVPRFGFANTFNGGVDDNSRHGGTNNTNNPVHPHRATTSTVNLLPHPPPPHAATDMTRSNPATEKARGAWDRSAPFKNVPDGLTSWLQYGKVFPG